MSSVAPAVVSAPGSARSSPWVVGGAWLLGLVHTGCVAAPSERPAKSEVAGGQHEAGATEDRDGEAPLPASATEGGALADSGAFAADAASPPALERCVAPPGVADSPRSIVEAIELINALPKPTSVACFVESLARPLRVMATASLLSAQPAAGARSPRIFIFVGDALILSVVPDGVGRDLLELSELTSVHRSVKGEIPFPLTSATSTGAMVAHIEREPVSVCALCHAGEQLREEGFFPGALESDALRPLPESEVSIDDVRAEYELCDAEAEPARCAMLSALFAHGDVTHQAFPQEMRTFF